MSMFLKWITLRYFKYSILQKHYTFQVTQYQLVGAEYNKLLWLKVFEL